MVSCQWSVDGHASGHSWHVSAAQQRRTLVCHDITLLHRGDSDSRTRLILKYPGPDLVPTSLATPADGSRNQGQVSGSRAHSPLVLDDRARREGAEIQCGTGSGTGIVCLAHIFWRPELGKAAFWFVTLHQPRRRRVEAREGRGFCKTQ